MPCENYREALTEAAAADSALSRELRSHLDACPSCRAAFTEEQQLFASIDTGLRARASSDVPPTFLPRVRASLENASGSQRRWAPFLIFAAASAAIVLSVFIATRPRHAINDTQARQNSSAQPGEQPVTSDRSEANGTSAIAAFSHSYRAAPRRNSIPANSASSSQLEVLVPPEEREAFARFISSQHGRSEVVIAVVVPAGDNKGTLLSLKPLEIAELEVTPLEALASEVPDGTEEKQ
jgi:anti-sigma factor RsiW